MKISLSKRQRAVLEVMSKPKIPAEIRNQIGLNKNSNLSSTIKKLVEMDLLKCLTPKARLGKLYGLTKKGIGLRKIHGYAEYSQPKDVNWYLYGWVVCGKQRKAILKAMIPEVPMTLRQIRERALEYNPRLSRTNANDTLRSFVRTKIATRILVNCNVTYYLTYLGEKIKEQITCQ
jgi:hypothetical protein